MRKNAKKPANTRIARFSSGETLRCRASVRSRRSFVFLRLDSLSNYHSEDLERPSCPGFALDFGQGLRTTFSCVFEGF